MKKWIERYIVFIIGLYFLTLGVVMIIRSSLGTSPISSLNYVVSLNTPLTLGTATFILNMILIVGQLWFVKGNTGTRRDRIEIMMQIPFSVLFSAFLDMNMLLLENFSPAGYISAFALLVTGCIIQAFGVVLELRPNVVAMSAEGFVKYASRRYSKNFGKFKVAFDVTLVLLAVVASLGFRNSIDGVREGTVIAALSVGLLVNFINNFLIARTPLRRIIPDYK